MMKYKIICIVTVLAALSSSLFAAEQKNYSYKPTAYTPEGIVTPFNHEPVKGFICEYTDLCSVSYVTEGTTAEPANTLLLVPYAHVLKAAEVQPFTKMEDARGTMYLHVVPIIKEGKGYTLQFLTMVSKDKSQLIQTMYLFDADSNGIDPSAFKLNDSVKALARKRARELYLPADAHEQFLKTLE